MKSFIQFGIVLIIVELVFVTGNIDTNEIGYCLRDPSQPSLRECVGRQAINFLQHVEDTDNFTFAAGMMLAKNETIAKRSIINFLDQDPVDFRGILENAGIVFSQRSLQWNMKGLYPGLQLRIGPSADASSQLEFVMDPEHEVDERKYLVEEPSTARILTKRFLLPFLLGLKFKLITLVPIIFAGVVFLCQKAAILAKFALFLTSIFGISLGTAATGIGLGESFLGGGGFSGGFGGGGYGHHQHHHGIGLGYGTHHGGVGLGGYAEPHHYDGIIRNGRKVQYDMPRKEPSIPQEPPSFDKFYDFEKNVLMHDRNQQMFEKNDPSYFEQPSSESASARGFVWTDV